MIKRSTNIDISRSYRAQARQPRVVNQARDPQITIEEIIFSLCLI